MTFCISTEDIHNICTPNAVSRASVWHWTKGLPRQRKRFATGGTGLAYFRLVDLVPVLRKTRKGLSGDRLRAMVELAGPLDPSVPVEGDHDAFFAVLNDAEKQRLERAAYRFARAMAGAFFDRYIFVDREGMLKKLALSAPVLRYVLCRDRTALPHTDSGWTEWAAAFVLANSTPEIIKKLSSNKTDTEKNNV